MPHISWLFLLPMVGLAMVVKWEQLICRWGRASFNSWRVPSGTIPKTCSVFNVGISPSSLERKRETFRVAVSTVTVPLELHDPIFTHCIIFYTIQTEDIICNQWFEEIAKVNPQSTGHSLGNMALGNTQVYFVEFLITKKLGLFKIQTYFLSFSIPGLYSPPSPPLLVYTAKCYRVGRGSQQASDSKCFTMA